MFGFVFRILSSHGLIVVGDFVVLVVFRLVRRRIMDGQVVWGRLTWRRFEFETEIFVVGERRATCRFVENR